MKHADEVFKSAVEALGEMTADQLAETVRKAHITGRPSTSYQCPMAKLLDIQCGVKSHVVGVGKKYIVRRIDAKRYERVPTPKSVTKFLVNFDIGKYPELFAPPPRATKEARPDRRKRVDNRTGSRHRKIKARRNLVALLGGRGHVAGT